MKYIILVSEESEKSMIIEEEAYNDARMNYSPFSPGLTLKGTVTIKGDIELLQTCYKQI